MNFRHSSENNLQTQLSMKEMLEISNQISDCYSSAFTLRTHKVEDKAKLSRAELLEISQNISLYYAPSRLLNTQTLVTLPIDPHHLYIYWDLGKGQAPSFSQQLVNDELSLLVFSQGEDKKKVFQAPVNKLKAGKFIHLTKADKAFGYFACIGKINSENNFVSFIKSNKTYAFQVKEERIEINKVDDSNKVQFINFVEKNNSFNESSNFDLSFFSTNFSAKGKK